MFGHEPVLVLELSKEGLISAQNTVGGHTRDSLWLFSDLSIGLLSLLILGWSNGILGLLDSRSRSYFFSRHGICLEVIDSRSVNIADRYRDCFMIQGRSVLLLYIATLPIIDGSMYLDDHLFETKCRIAYHVKLHPSIPGNTRDQVSEPYRQTPLSSLTNLE
jgi:hypothetical protein